MIKWSMIKLTAVHFARPNPMQICTWAWIYCWTKKLENQDWAYGSQAVAGRWAMGRYAVGLLLGLIPLSTVCVLQFLEVGSTYIPTLPDYAGVSRIQDVYPSPSFSLPNLPDKSDESAFKGFAPL